MSAMPPAAFCEKHPLWYRLIVLFIITAGVYLAFRYLLVIFIPFIIAYLIMRMLFPVIWFCVTGGGFRAGLPMEER